MKITILNKALCGVLWRRKNHCKNQQITRTAVLPAPLTFCVNANKKSHNEKKDKLATQTSLKTMQSPSFLTAHVNFRML